MKILQFNYSMSCKNGTFTNEISSIRSISSDEIACTKAKRKKSCWARATDPARRKGRRIQLLQMLVLPFIPILALIIQTANTLHDILIYRQEVSEIESQVRYSFNNERFWCLFEAPKIFKSSFA